MKRLIKILTDVRVWLIIILLGAFLVRLYKIDNPIADWHSWRQADTASVTRIYIDEGIDVLFPQYYDISSIQTGSYNPAGLRLVEFPIYNALHALLVNYLPINLRSDFISKTWKEIGYTPGPIELWGRLLSIISSLISTLMLYAIGKEIYHKWIGLLSALFFAFIPFNIYFSRVILPEPMAIAFALSGLYAFVRFIKNESVWMLYISAVLFAASMLIKPFSAFYLIPVIYLSVKKFGFKQLLGDAYILIRYLIFIILVIAPFFAWRIFINHNPIGIPHFDWAFNGDGIRFRPAFWRWIFAERVGNLILGVWGVVLLAYGLITRPKEKYGYFMHYFILAGVVYMTIFATASVRHDYYQTFIIPAISLALAVGTYSLWNSTSFNKIASRFLVLFSLFIMFIAGWVQVKEYYKVNNPAIIKAGLAIDKYVSPYAKVIAPYSGDTAFLYQLHRWGWPVVDTSIDEIIGRGAEYFVAVNFNDPDVAMLEAKYKTVVKNSDFIIIDLLLPKD